MPYYNRPRENAFGAGVGTGLGKLLSYFLNKDQNERQQFMAQMLDAYKDAQVTGDMARLWQLQETAPEAASEFQRLTGRVIPEKPRPQLQPGIEPSNAPLPQQTGPPILPGVLSKPPQMAPVPSPAYLMGSTPGGRMPQPPNASGMQARAAADAAKPPTPRGPGMEGTAPPEMTPDQSVQYMQKLVKGFPKDVQLKVLEMFGPALGLEALIPEGEPGTPPNIDQVIKFDENFWNATPEQRKTYIEGGGIDPTLKARPLKEIDEVTPQEATKFWETYPGATEDDWKAFLLEKTIPTHLMPAGTIPRMSEKAYGDFYGTTEGYADYYRSGYAPEELRQDALNRKGMKDYKTAIELERANLKLQGERQAAEDEKANPFKNADWRLAMAISTSTFEDPRKIATELKNNTYNWSKAIAAWEQRADIVEHLRRLRTLKGRDRMKYLKEHVAEAIGLDPKYVKSGSAWWQFFEKFLQGVDAQVQSDSAYEQMLQGQGQFKIKDIENEP